MIAIWIFLYLEGLCRLLAMNGFTIRGAVTCLVLLPILALFIGGTVRRRLPALFGANVLRVAGTLGFAALLLLSRHLHLAGWDVRDAWPNLLVATGGLGSFWVLLGSAEEASPSVGHWLWIAFWLLTGFMDPALPLVGAGLAGFLTAWGLLPRQPVPGGGRPAMRQLSLTFFLVGLTFSKAGWDFGPRPDWAFAGAALGLGAALAQLGPLHRLLARIPDLALPLGIGLLAILYTPGLLLPWGALLGVLVALAWARASRPFATARLGGALLLGMVVSFALHSNLGLPGLRHLLWLGN